MHDDAASDPVIGRLIERGLHDELTGTAYAIIDGADGRVHHLRFADLDQTGDAVLGPFLSQPQSMTPGQEGMVLPSKCRMVRWLIALVGFSSLGP